MELALSLGDAPNSNNKPFGFLSKPSNNLYSNSSSSSLMALGYCVALGHHSRSGSVSGSVHYDQDRRDVLQHDDDDDDDDDGDDKNPILSGSGSGFDPPVQLDLLPLVPVPRSSHLQFSWISHRLMPEVGYSETEEKAAAGAVAAVAALSSPKSTMSCLEMELGFRKRSSLSDMENERGGGSSRIMSDDEEINNNNIIIGCAPKKLRLSKHQSAFLEESFKEHTTLNPKQKLALAKQLNLRPRQVEVWFQNRRARTKLKQTEVDCEYLRRCCETLTEENRRLQKELQELRALKTTPSHPFYNMHLPPTTLTMCPSCERVVVTTSPPAASVTVPVPNPPPSLCLANNPRISPFPHTLHQQAAS